MLDSSFFLVGDSEQIYGVAVCVPAVIIIFVLAYVIIKELGEEAQIVFR